MTAVTKLQDVKTVTVKEMAHALRVSPMTIYRLIKSGELESIRVGRTFRVHEKSFEKYLAEHSGAKQ